MKYLWSLIIVLCAFPASATSIVPKSLEEMVAESDHIVVATIRAVDMVNARGVLVLAPDARTGPANPTRCACNWRSVKYCRRATVPYPLR